MANSGWNLPREGAILTTPGGDPQQHLALFDVTLTDIDACALNSLRERWPIARG